VVTAAYAFLGRRQAVAALLTVSLLNNVTHVFGGPPQFAALTRYGVMFAAALSVFVFHRGGVPRAQFTFPLLGAGFIASLLILHSLMFSAMPLLSVLKAFSFGLAVTSIFVACASMSRLQRRDLEIQVLGIVSALLVLSVPLIFSGAGYFRGTAGFTGLIKHPQAFGVIASLVAVVSWMNVLTQKRLRYGFLAMGIVAVIEIFLSRARVGGVVVAGGVAAGFVLPWIASAWSRWRGNPRIVVQRAGALFVVGAVAAIVTGPVLVSQINRYLLKYNADDLDASAIDALKESRWMLIRPMLENIERHPFSGVGFGVPGEGDKGGAVVEDPIFGLPIMAVVEKGFLPVAIIEELGFPLGIIIYLWIGSLLLVAIRGGAISAGVGMGAILVNAGESVFFSAGGLGMYIWVFLCLAMTSSAFNAAGERQSLF